MENTEPLGEGNVVSGCPLPTKEPPNGAKVPLWLLAVLESERNVRTDGKEKSRWTISLLLTGIFFGRLVTE